MRIRASKALSQTYQCGYHYRETGNLRPAQLLLAKSERTLRYLSFDNDDALETSSGVDLP